MGYLIAVSGKGGVGKTTVAALIVSRLIAANRRPVLAVDADPNTCLDQALGVRAEHTIGRIREEAKRIAAKGLGAGISKHELLELKIQESLVESEDFDLIAMGRSEGPGCYCYANNVLKAAMAKLAGGYPYVVLDNEAGLENLSRRIVSKVDLLVMVSDPSNRGLETLRRLHTLASEMEVGYSKLAVVINRTQKETLPGQAEQLCSDVGADHVVGLPEDGEIRLLSENGEPLSLLKEDNETVKKIDRLLSTVLV